MTASLRYISTTVFRFFLQHRLVGARRDPCDLLRFVFGFYTTRFWIFEAGLAEHFVFN